MNPEKEKWILLIVLSLIWGSSFILIKKGLDHFTAYQVGSLRVLIAGLALAPVAIVNMRKFPQNKLKWLVIAAITGNFIPMFLFPMAEEHVSSSIAGIMNSMMPIWVIVVGALIWKVRSTRNQILGVVISFAGACTLLLGSGKGGEFQLWPIFLLLLATLMYAISVTTVANKLKDIPATVLSGFVFFYILFLPSLLCLISTDFFNEFTGSKDQMIGLGYVGILAIFGTGIAMLLQYRLLKISSALFASTVTLLMPVVAVLWGILDGEKLTLIQYFGGAVILGGLLFMRSNSGKTSR